MKKFFIYMASAAFMFAACNKAEIDAPVEDVNTPVETETITVDLNPMTKTSLDGMNTVWSNGDVVSVTVDGKNIGTLKLVEGSTFSGEVEAGHKGDAILNYPAGVTAVPTEQKAVENSFANGAALLEGTTTMDALRNGEGASLQNKTALLKFKSARSGNVAFTVGTETYTVTECEANKEYYASIAPAAEALLSYTLSGNAGTKSATTSFEAGKIYSLGTLTEEFVPQEGYVYLIPNNYWKTDGARFATYFFSETWVDMTLVEGQVNVYQCAIPEGENGGMLFCRMNPNNTENRWNVDNEPNAPLWNQTIDLSLTDGCIYTMNEGSWDKGTWSGNPAVEKPVLPEVTPGESSEWAIIGDFDKTGTWVEKQMVTTSESGVFVIEGLHVPNDYFSVLIKKFGDSDWSVKYGGGIVYFNPSNHMTVYSGGTDISITKAGTYDFYFDLNNTKLYVVAAGVDYTTAPEQTVEGEEPKQEEPEVTAKVVYLKPNSNWTQSNARFAAYFWGGTPGEKWVSMTAVGDGTYEVHLPEGYDYGCNIIFCRMNPSTTANNWNNKWNQTSDLKTPTDGKNLYTVKDGTWDKGGGTWSVK